MPPSSLHNTIVSAFFSAVAELNEAESEAKSLRSRLSLQKVSIEDVERMSRERQTNEEQLFTLGKRVKELQRYAWEKESEANRKLQEVRFCYPIDPTANVLDCSTCLNISASVACLICGAAIRDGQVIHGPDPQASTAAARSAGLHVQAAEPVAAGGGVCAQDAVRLLARHSHCHHGRPEPAERCGHRPG